MPFYKLDDLEKKKSAVNSKVESGAVPGEFMNVGIVTNAINLVKIRCLRIQSNFLKYAHCTGSLVIIHKVRMHGIHSTAIC